MRKGVTLFFLLLLAIGGGLGWRFVLSGGSSPETAAVERRNLEITVEVSGKIKADRSVTFSFPILGQLEKLASGGAVFKEGDVVARLKTNELYAALQQAYASLNKARSTLSYYLEVQGETEKTYLGSDDISRAKRNEAKANAEAAAASVQYYQFAVDQTQAAYQKAFLIAPFSGVVGQTLAREGEVVSVGAPVLTFVDPASYYFEGEVDEIDVGALRGGLPVQIQLDAYGEQRSFAGEVSSTDLTSHTTSSGGTGYYVRILFKELSGEDTANLFRSGLNGNAKILKEMKVNVLALPAAAVLSENGKNYVEVLTGSKKVKREVALGALVADFYEVLAGLEAGETVVVGK